MTKNVKAKFLWVPLGMLIMAFFAVVVPWLYGAGKTQATLTAADTALQKADLEIIKDVEKIEKNVEELEKKFDTYHIEQKAANTEILSRLPK